MQTLYSMTSRQFSLTAAAKINLFLHITGKRPDGYHLLQSLMVFITLGDQLTFSPYEGFFLDVTGPFGSDLTLDPEDNLIYRAAQLLAREYNIKPSGRIVLEKNLPIASGIGGGSSDAAMTLRGLQRLWGLPEEPDRMERLAYKLGADVPACLFQRPVWAEGIGEKLTWLQGLPVFYLVVVNPLQPTATPEVFRRYPPRFSQPLQHSARRKSMAEWLADLGRYRNDLTDAAVGVTPIISRVLAAIHDTQGCRIARLSGSGATCFGIYESEMAAAAAVNKLRGQYPDWWVMTAQTL